MSAWTQTLVLTNSVRTHLAHTTACRACLATRPEGGSVTVSHQIYHYVYRYTLPQTLITLYSTCIGKRAYTLMHMQAGSAVYALDYLAFSLCFLCFFKLLLLLTRYQWMPEKRCVPQWTLWEFAGYLPLPVQWGLPARVWQQGLQRWGQLWHHASTYTLNHCLTDITSLFLIVHQTDRQPEIER